MMRLSWDPAVPIKKGIIKENGLIKCTLISASQKVIVCTVGEMHCAAIDLQNLHLHSVLLCLAPHWSFVLKKIPLLLFFSSSSFPVFSQMHPPLCHLKEEQGLTAALQDLQEGISGQIVS